MNNWTLVRGENPSHIVIQAGDVSGETDNYKTILDCDKDQVSLSALPLILAAPELLEALRHAEDLLRNDLTAGSDDLAQLRAAIAKAEGKEA